MAQAPATNEWYASWFDSPYYHILYKHRDEHEARTFIDNLAHFLAFKPDNKVLDLACGRGRHAIYLSGKGFDVTGVDLSAKSIDFAKGFENDRLHFMRHDMREMCLAGHFDFVLNMFTSFGYFDQPEDDRKVVSAAACNLKPQGKLVIDFLNSYKVSQEMGKQQPQQIVSEGITFHIRKSLENGFIIKRIDFEHNGQHFQFQEQVRAFFRTDFMNFFEYAGLRCLHTFGNYQLGPFDQNTSERMIFVAEKS